MIKVIVAGSRGFTNYPLLEQELSKLASIDPELEIVSGTARGADQLGEKFAEKNGLPIKRFPADWDRHGKKAGYLRNEQMAEYANACIVFWDGRSPGSKHMIDIAKARKLKVRVVRF